MAEKGAGQVPANTCPTPTKSRFATQEAAQKAAHRASNVLGKTLYPYDTCPCGWVHLTSKKRYASSVEAVTADGGVLSDEDFARLIRNEVVGRCAPEDAATLRRPEHLLRWADALKGFQIDIATQLAVKAGQRDAETAAWRRRLARVQKALADRRLEVKRLLIECHSDNDRRVASIRSADERELFKEKKRTAGENAILRLKNAHPQEFVTYLKEEYAAVGLAIPASFAKYEKTEGKEGSDE